MILYQLVLQVVTLDRGSSGAHAKREGNTCLGTWLGDEKTWQMKKTWQNIMFGYCWDMLGSFCPEYVWTLVDLTPKRFVILPIWLRLRPDDLIDPVGLWDFSKQLPKTSTNWKTNKLQLYGFHSIQLTFHLYNLGPIQTSFQHLAMLAAPLTSARPAPTAPPPSTAARRQQTPRSPWRAAPALLGLVAVRSLRSAQRPRRAKEEVEEVAMEVKKDVEEEEVEEENMRESGLIIVFLRDGKARPQEFHLAVHLIPGRGAQAKSPCSAYALWPQNWAGSHGTLGLLRSLGLLPTRSLGGRD